MKMKKHTLVLLILLNISIQVICEKALLKSNYKLTEASFKKRAKDSNDVQSIVQSGVDNSIKQAGTPQTKVLTQEDLQKEDLPEVPIYYQGWIKYFKYLDEKKAERPKHFFKNPDFSKQDEVKSDADDNGLISIPSEKHFFTVLYKDTMNILTSRNNAIMQVHDSLIIDFIKTIPEDQNYHGGVRDFGKFNEGSCFQVNTIRPSTMFQMSAQNTEPQAGIKEIWFICTDDDNSKKNLMNYLIKLKLKKQHALGVFMSKQSYKKLNPSDQEKQESISRLLGPQQPLNDPNAKPEDGKWIILQDWTGCTLKCGGGLSYQQLMCIPPKSGGKPCEGPSIRTKPCNTQPCPEVKALSSVLRPEDNKANGDRVEKPIVKVMPLSQRPQRYDKCFLKDGDALMLKNDKETAQLDGIPKIPVRIVMNNKSVTVYQDETLQTNYYTFILKDTSFNLVKDDNGCFILKNTNQKAQFCTLGDKKFVEEWNYDFHLFKYQCKQKRDVVELDKNEEDRLKREYDEKMNAVKASIVSEKTERIKKKANEEEETKLEKEVAQTQTMTLRAVEKESKLEELLEKEEAEREDEEQRELEAQVQEEKKKDECLMKSIKAKEIEEQYNLNKINASEQIEKLKEEAKKQIIIKRQAIKDKIQSMRKRAERKKAALKAQIMTIRTKTAGKLQKFAKNGDASKCFIPDSTNAEHIKKIEDYCTIAYSDNFLKFNECKSPESFCFNCCENEFGEIHIVDRDKCYKQCEVTGKSAPNVGGCK